MISVSFFVWNKESMPPIDKSWEKQKIYLWETWKKHIMCFSNFSFRNTFCVSVGKTLWKSQNMSLNGFFWRKHHLVPAVCATCPTPRDKMGDYVRIKILVCEILIVYLKPSIHLMTIQEAFCKLVQKLASSQLSIFFRRNSHMSTSITLSHPISSINSIKASLNTWLTGLPRHLDLSKLMRGVGDWHQITTFSILSRELQVFPE